MSVTDFYRISISDKYFDFKGRARRKEFFFFFLFNILIFIALSFFSIILCAITASPYVLLIPIIYILVIIIPTISVILRRLHDIGKSNWYFFLFLIPVIGILLFFILFIIDGDANNNIYGIDPKRRNITFDFETIKK